MPDSAPNSPNLPPAILEQLRHQIDALDEKLIGLLNERARVVLEVGSLKRSAQIPFYAPDREKVVMERVGRLNAGPLPDRCIQAIWREMMTASLALERPPRVGFLGPPGTFSHMAAVRKFCSTGEYVPLDDIATVFDAVVRGHIDYGLVPVENSIGGGVVDTLDAFVQSSARICAEVLITVHHNLLAKEPWEQVRKIASKPEIFSQCRNWLLTVAKDRQVEPSASSSRAAELASVEPGTAAIGSSLAGELYGLHVLFENIEENPDNVTRFFVIGREPARRSGDDKTGIMFTTAHKPGALSAVLEVFKDRGINLTDIEKRPSKKVNWEYYFYIDATGHLDEPTMQAAIEEARQHCLQLTVLGSYPRATAALL